MSFRGRLRLFFALIVVVPLIALGVLLFARAEGTQTGKADARIATGLRAAMGVYAEETKRADARVAEVAGDPALRRAIADRRITAAERRLVELAADDVVALELFSAGGEPLVRTDSRNSVAAAESEPTTRGGPRSAVVVGSVTDADRMAERISALTGFQATVARGGRRLASTLPQGADPGEYRGKHAEGRAARTRHGP